MQKGTLLYKEMSRYRIKFLIINILLTVLYILFIINKMPYLKTEHSGPSPLDTQRFISETDTIVIEEIIELGRKDHKNPDGSLVRSTSYWQDDKYYFNIKADSVTDTDHSFKGTMGGGTTGTKVKEYDLYKLYMAQIGGRNVPVLAYANQKVTKNLTAYITDVQKPILSVLSETIGEGESLEVSEYMLDVRNLEMDTASTDYACFWIFMLLLIFLYGKVITYFVKPATAPTYRQLARYGDIESVAEDINRQSGLSSAYTEDKKLILEDYILSKSYFKIVVVKNHMAKH